MAEFLEREFSPEKMEDYAKTCVGVAEQLPWALKGQDANTLLIPSRGAIPIFIGAAYALGKLSKEYGWDFGEISHGWVIPAMLNKYVHNSEEPTDSCAPRKTVLLCPFTADLNMQKFFKYHSIEDKLGDDFYTDTTRSFWTQVVGALTKGAKERAKNPYLQFYLSVLRDIEGRQDLAEEIENSPQIRRFAMIDTVISGRASNTILSAFDDIKLNPKAILVVDDGATKLKPGYRAYFEQKVHQDLVKMITSQRIVTEDRGASLEGVVGVIYPGIMHALQQDTQLKKIGLGAGSWHLIPKGDPHATAFNLFTSALKKAIDIIYNNDYLLNESAKKAGETEEAKAELREDLEGLIKILDKEDLLSSNHPSIKRVPTRLKQTQVYETNSHVTHISFEKRDTTDFIKRTKRARSLK